ncbi:mitochondrial ribosomal protein S18B [Brevipalpus obovatus]|uniref:mitochondrial ribosomal protein S18B n=1 Tax=Brevipalpus obovatus TaxID=246614 RepID=UPI003D9DC2BD
MVLLKFVNTLHPMQRSVQILCQNAVVPALKQVSSVGQVSCPVVASTCQRFFANDAADDRGAHAYQNIYGSLRRPKAKLKKIPIKDRRVPISWEVSVKYLQSQTYHNTYGDYKVWQMFRRNFGGYHENIPRLTKKSCVGDDGYILGNNPCPICRDKYLTLDYRNVELIKQFIDLYTDQLIPLQRSNLCQVKYEELMTEYIKAKDYGTISFTMPQRDYDYQEYYHKDLLKDYLRDRAETLDDPVMRKISLYPEYVDPEPAKLYFPNILPEKALE